MSPFLRAIPRLLLRRGPLDADLSLLGTLLEPVMGEDLLRLPVEIWSHWPWRLDGAWALRLAGVRLVLLDGIEPHSHMPQASLRRLLAGDAIEFKGDDRQLCRCRPPGFYALCGPAIHRNRIKQFEISLQEHCLFLPAVEQWGGRDET